MLTPIALVVGVAAVGALFVLDRFAASIVRPRHVSAERDVGAVGVPVERVTIPSGGLTLEGYFVEGAAAGGTDPRTLVILAHGWGGNYGAVLPLAEALAHAGHDALLFDARGHGESPATPFVTIRQLRDDARAACDFAERRWPRRTRALVGHSIGGSASVLAAASGAAVGGVVTVASPADVLDITAESLSERGLPGQVLIPLLLPFWWRRARSTFRRLSPETEIARLGLPVLVVHAAEDGRIRRPHGERLAAAAGTTLQVIEGAQHTDVVEHPETARLVDGFVRETVGGSVRA